jgi:hypothetical protein
MGSATSKPAAPEPAAAAAAPAIDPNLLAHIQSRAANQKSQAETILQGLAPAPAPAPAPAAPVVATSSRRWWFWPLVLLVLATAPVIAIAIYNLVRPNNKVELFNDYPGMLRSVPYNGQSLPRSMNAPSGLEFSYGFWLVVNDWGYRYGERKHVFTKGDMTKGEQCPAVFLSPTENAIEIFMDVFPNRHEHIVVNNLPSQKWMHVGIVVRDEKTVEVYTNGTLRSAKRAAGIIKQNNSGITVADGGGFSGFLTRFEYYDHALSEAELERLVADVPKKQPAPTYATPPY